MDVNSNKYTFGFTIVMVIVVASLLAFASESLKPMQKKNIRREKMQNILLTLNIEPEKKVIEEKFNSTITEQLILNHKGEVTDPENLTAFDIDVVKEYKSLEPDDRHYPLYIGEDNGEKRYIVPMAGKGLWGPIWGFLAFSSDMNTVKGSLFDHKSETPGLGAEIKEDFFENQFIDKTIYDENGEFVSIDVVKGGAGPENKHGVDAISGGTITSNGVDEMIERTMKVYTPYFKEKKN